MCLLSAKFEILDDERQLTSGTALINFRPEPRGRTDSILARYEMARLEADSVCSAIPDLNLLTA
eukprot:983495-Pyramimonas_sp.AAC.1